MKQLSSIEDCVKWRAECSGSVGFIPTLGGLHEGHFSLIKSSKKTCDKTIVSIYLNPTQFAPDEDLESYPQTLEKDASSLNKLGIDALFTPATKQMYSTSKLLNNYSSPLFKKLEGGSRPHFFNGVTTVVAKLFDIVSPTHAFFGQKDAQQLLIIKNMIADLQYSILLVACPTIRDENGLALSSRNNYLTTRQQKEASIIFYSLQQMIKHLDNGERRARSLKTIFKNELEKVSGFAIDYISIACPKRLSEMSSVKGEALISTAVYFNSVRLIDNIYYNDPS